MTGVEVRQSLIDKAQETFAFYGQDPETYRFVCGDLFEVLARAAPAKRLSQPGGGRSLPSRSTRAHHHPGSAGANGLRHRPGAAGRWVARAGQHHAGQSHGLRAAASIHQALTARPKRGFVQAPAEGLW